MKYVLKITPAAFSDIKMGIEYYNGQQKDLGKKFTSVIQDSLTKIKKMPLASSIAYDDVRYRVVAKFPYVILYKVQGNLILIARVFNTYQRSVY